LGRIRSAWVVEPPTRQATVTIRDLRNALKCSQAEFAARLSVPLESYRLWDAGRRDPPSSVIVRARELAEEGPDDAPRSLPRLARQLGVSVYRLREAARDGRLAVTYGTRVAFGRPVPRATRIAGEAYKLQFYGKTVRWAPRPAPPSHLLQPPDDYDERLVKLRRSLGLSQAQLARRIGAAGKAVVYQWESRKRSPSPVLWRRISDLSQTSQREVAP
jgi:DNA-binding transcriptional regulator YiaG